MYLPNNFAIQPRDHREFHDNSLNAGQLAGITICMVLILAGIVCFLFVLGRHCYRSNGTNLWPSWCCTCYPADALEKARESNELPSYSEATRATQHYGAREIDVVQPPKKAHMTLPTTDDNEGKSGSDNQTSMKQKKSMLSTMFSSADRKMAAPLA